MVILGERPERIGAEGQGHGLGAVGNKITGDREEITGGIFYLDRFLVIHQVNAARTAVYQPEFGLKI